MMRGRAAVFDSLVRHRSRFGGIAEESGRGEFESFAVVPIVSNSLRAEYEWGASTSDVPALGTVGLRTAPRRPDDTGK
jgi:hypothetical protein